MRLLLVRHGQTASNVHRLLDTAVPGADLDAVGRSQAELLVERLAHHPIDAVYTSDLVRTQQTVAPLAAARGLEPRTIGGFREIQAGEDEMSPDSSRYIAVLKAWGEGDPEASLPGGEDAETFLERFDAGIAAVEEAGHDLPVVVSHGAALRAWVLARAVDLDVEWAVARRMGNTAVLLCERDAAGDWRLLDWDEGAPEIGAPAEDAGPDEPVEEVPEGPDLADAER
ncbi:histidine phosphatase family protein [Propioniciclava soli]|uniref:Histidine phosphatase family protein n=1 Tax=Propioniciclava soli TaxID=2775081 RepID=A0ABZ3CA18_9ACTN|nr:histidine phosphatase family protein [Propioniciclava soli]